MSNRPWPPPEQPRRAVGYMAGNVVVDALAGLVIALTINQGLDLAIGAGIVVGGFVGTLLLGVGLSPTVVAKARLYSPRNLKSLNNRLGGLLMISRLDWLLIALAVGWAGPLTVAAVLGLHTIVYVLMLSRFFKPSNVRLTIGVREIGVMFVATLGLVIVIAGQQGSWAPHGFGLTVLGIGLAGAGVICQGLSAVRFGLARQIYRQQKSTYQLRDELAILLTIVGITSLPLAIILPLLVVAFTNQPGVVSDLLIGGVFGALLPTAGIALRSAANLSTSNLSVNALGYFVPPLTIGLLILAKATEPVLVWLVLLGGLIITLANIQLGLLQGYRKNQGLDTRVTPKD